MLARAINRLGVVLGHFPQAPAAPLGKSPTLTSAPSLDGHRICHHPFPVKKILSRAALSVTFIAACMAAPGASAQMYPQRVNATDLESAPYNSTGLLFTEVSGYDYRGSAAVVRDSRLLYSCAHVLYDAGIWATGGEFARAWNSSTSPSSSQTVGIRGFRYYAPYSGGNRAADFALDFAICYRSANTSFGPALPWLTNGSNALADSSIPKLILGYPARRDYDRARGYYYQHRTGDFTRAMRQSKNSYYTLSGISTGPGNSGGPVLASIDGAYTFAGVLVSGSSNSIGVHGLNKAANAMAASTLADFSAGSNNDAISKTVKNTQELQLPDASTLYSYRDLIVSGLGTTSQTTKFSLLIETPFRGDLDVYLRSPNGRVRWVHKHTVSAAGRDLVVSKANYNSTFAGSDPNGAWRVFMRDYYRGDRATFKKAVLIASGA